MATLKEKIDKQFTYQRTVYATTASEHDLAVSVDHMAEIVSRGMRYDARRQRGRVKLELERRVGTGELVRWLDRYPGSTNPLRKDQYFLSRAQ